MSGQLDPQARAVLEGLARSNRLPYAQVGVAAARELYRAMRFTLGPRQVEEAQVTDLSVDGAAGPLAARLYRPVASTEEDILPAVVYFHGGGWVLGDLDTHDDVCRALANFARCAVVAVDYRLAPEHKFPAPVEDAIAATRAIARQAEELNVDRARLAVAGDSAGATLAAVTALALRESELSLAMQVLLYPSTDMAATTESHERYAEGYGLTRENILWFRDAYLRTEADALDWRASPLRAPDVSGLPPTCIITAGFDPLRDEARLYADRLYAAGVPVTYECFEGMIHGFVNMSGAIAAARHALYRVAQMLRPALGLAPHTIRS